MGKDHRHRVCTYEEAEHAIRTNEHIFVNDCFCRTPARDGKTPWEYCGHPLDTCMGFDRKSIEEFETEYREITREEALEKFDTWRKEGNVFRFMEEGKWVCYCCACGCYFFKSEEDRKKHPCDPSGFIEKTDPETCISCGECIDICAFKARRMENDTLVVDALECYGCSACAYMCPEDAIRMVPR